MKKKKHTLACDLSGSIYGKKGMGRKKVSPNHKSVGRKELTDVYDKFYKNQVAALYRAINNIK